MAIFLRRPVGMDGCHAQLENILCAGHSPMPSDGVSATLYPINF